MDRLMKLTDNGESSNRKHVRMNVICLHIFFAKRYRYGFLSIPVIREVKWKASKDRDGTNGFFLSTVYWGRVHAR